MQRSLGWLFVFAGAWMTSACAPDLRERVKFEIEGEDFSKSNVFVRENGDGTIATKVQATSKTDWVYVDLDARLETSADSPEWDLAFQRFKIKANAQATVRTGVRKDSSDLNVPVPDDLPTASAVEDQSVFIADGGWYYYDLSKHVLSARENVYFVRTTQGATVSMIMQSYYDSNGSGGYPTFHWLEHTPQ